ncbi:MAG: hypothetical protein AAF500_15610 [Myxococcota bacterium]
MRLPIQIAILVLSSALTGCSNGEGGNAATGGAGGNAGASGEDPLFVLAQVLFVPPEGFQGFATLVDSTDADAMVDIANGIEIPEFSGVFEGPRPGTFFVSTGGLPEVILFELTEDDTIEEIDRVSFAGRGVTVPRIAHTVVTVNETKAYYVDAEGLRLFTFSPQTMTIEAEASLEGLGAPSAANPEALVLPVPWERTEGELILYSFYRNLIEGTNEQRVRVAFIDTSTDEITVIEDDRCGFTTNVSLTPSGDLYFGSDAWAGAMEFTRPDVNPRPCLLRVLAGEREFDPNFQIFFSDLTGEDISGGLIAASGNEAYILRYDTNVIDPDGLTDQEMLQEPSWRTYRITLGDTITTAEEITELGIRSGSVFPITAEGEIYDAITAADFSETTLFRTTVDGVPERALTAQGLLFGIVRLR